MGYTNGVLGSTLAAPGLLGPKSARGGSLGDLNWLLVCIRGDQPQRRPS